MRFNPGDWSGHSAVIVATGPSVTLADIRLIALASRRGAKVVAINDAAYPCWFAEIAYSSDIAWWKRHNNLPGFPGWRCGLRYVSGGATSQPAGIGVVEASGRDGFDPDPRFIRHGGNSGYAALHLTAHLGADRIILVGFDHAGGHFFGEHPKGLQRPTPYQRMIPRYAALATALAERKVRVVNTSPVSAIPYFRKAPLAAALEDLCALEA